MRRPYDTLVAYGQSKTAVNLFSLESDRRAQDFNVRSYALHPGVIHGTELGREASVELFQQMGFCDDHGNIKPEVLALLKTISQGQQLPFLPKFWSEVVDLLDEYRKALRPER